MLASFRLASRPRTDEFVGTVELAPVEPEEGWLEEPDLQVWSPFFPVIVTGPAQEDPDAIFGELDERFWAIPTVHAQRITQAKNVMNLVIVNLLATFRRKNEVSDIGL